MATPEEANAHHGRWFRVGALVYDILCFSRDENGNPFVGRADVHKDVPPPRPGGNRLAGSDDYEESSTTKYGGAMKPTMGMTRGHWTIARVIAGGAVMVLSATGLRAATLAAAPSR